MEKQTIQPFLSVANYHLIEQQINKLLNAYNTTKDRNVLLAVKGLVETEIEKNIQPSDVQLTVIERLYEITDRTQAKIYLESLKPYVIPFKRLTISNLKSLFKKEKKLKLPNIDYIDFNHICYFTWYDASTHRKYVVIEEQGKLKAIKGHVETNTIKGICTICHHHSDVSLFTTSKKGKTIDTFKKHSNYICTDSQSCNRNIADYKRVSDFFDRITQ